MLNFKIAPPLPLGILVSLLYIRIEMCSTYVELTFFRDEMCEL